ncbi:MAG TPA: hypothetical protein VGN09_26080 [Vicinamibacteria bacterium]
MKLRTAVLGAMLLLAVPLRAQEPPPVDPSDLINTLLGGLLGFKDMTGPELQTEVAEVGGVPFRSDVPLRYLTRAELSRYLKDVLDDEYPVAQARADQKTLVAFGLLAPGTDLRGVRARLLEENVAGFYDERPGKKQLYAVSEDRRLTPTNQLVLSHELRHALQDQYANVHDAIPASVGDFDDRRIAYLSLLEGDATLVMERFLLRRVPGMEDAELSGLSMPTPAVPGAPKVLADQLVLPYIVGRDFARAVWQRGGWDAIKAAWSRPPESSEQVLHPEKFFAREAPRPVDISYAPPGATLVNEGVLGELLTRTLLGEGSDAAAAGWGGDRFRVWDVGGRSLLVWRSVWDGPADLAEFKQALLGRLAAERTPAGERGPFRLFANAPWRFAAGEVAGGVVLVSSDDDRAFDAALAALARP